MDDDKTIIMSPLGVPDPTITDKPAGLCLEVSVMSSNGQQFDNQLFTESFTIGRAQDNDITIIDSEVSRHHIIIKKTNSNWNIRDLDSTNGSYINDEQLHHQNKLTLPCELKLGESNTQIHIRDYHASNKSEHQIALTLHDDITQIVNDKSKTLDSLTELPSREDVFRRYISEDNNKAGEYTQIVRDVIKKDKNKKIKKYNFLVLSIIALLIGAIALASYQYSKISNSKELAINIFYDMKNLEVELANAEISLRKNKNTSLLLAIDKKRATLKTMREHYAEYVEELGLLDSSKISKSKIDRLILKVAKSFGEIDIDLPKEFVTETKKYIRYWQNSPRMKKAMKRLYDKKYDTIALQALKEEGVPPQFLYLAMQESNFNIKAVGPRTRWGIAKGAWQFIPSTAREYGLKVGPLEDTSRYDPEDERHDFKKSSKAAAKYLKFIYSTEAQASGLLVMAGYNWGDTRVKTLINKMPNNPRERNFWKLIQRYTIPEETYNYVFYIFSAAVIAEDPQFFGFKFKSPTAKK